MFDLNSESWQDSWAHLVARAWSEEGFRERLIADPRAALAGAGVALPKELAVVIREGVESSRLSTGQLELDLPPVPPRLFDENLSDATCQESWQMIVCVC